MNCTNYFKHESNFGKPMPWIGLYIAAASLICAFAMLADLFNGFRYRQRWIPSRYFSLNPASLTIVAVAIKLSVDLNTPMPGKIEQAAKASTSILICISLGIFIPSLGNMGDAELITNFIALMILAITSIVNLGIQFNTGVIYGYDGTHFLALFTMSTLLIVCCSAAIALPSIKNELRVKYVKKYQKNVNEFMNGSSESVTKRLEEYLMKFSIIAHTGWPHHVLGRSLPCAFTWFLCTTTTMPFITSFIGLYERTNFCRSGESDYVWSALLILSTQIFALVVGLITLMLKIPKPSHLGNTLQLVEKNPWVIESYWTQMLVEIKQRPLFLCIQHKKCRKIVHHAKNSVCKFFISILEFVVLNVKIYHYYLFAYPCFFLWTIHRKLNIVTTNGNSHSASHSRINLIELKQYVLYLKGEEELIESMLKTTLHASNKYIESGKGEEPTHLLEFLETFPSPGFTGVFQFDSNRVPPLISEEVPPNCWSLPVVTLTSLAVSLPNIDPNRVNKLLDAVREGFYFVKKIEKNLNGTIYFINVRKAADGLWEEVDNHCRHLDIQLKELDIQGDNPTNILEFLIDSAMKKFLAFKTSAEKDSIWPIGAVTSYSLYRACQTILLDCQSRNFQYQTTNDLFLMLSSRVFVSPARETNTSLPKFEPRWLQLGWSRAGGTILDDVNLLQETG